MHRPGFDAVAIRVRRDGQQPKNIGLCSETILEVVLVIDHADRTISEHWTELPGHTPTPLRETRNGTQALQLPHSIWDVANPLQATFAALSAALLEPNLGTGRHTDNMFEKIWRRIKTAQTPEAEPEAPPTVGTGVPLRSLAPTFKEKQHRSYVRRLEEAIEDRDNKNIALTGRYGSGKSSILDKFEQKQFSAGKRVERISINTLGPDVADEEITNRIQKELVKQLVYRAEPGEMRHARFARRKDLTKRRIFLEATVVGIVVVGLLWLFGVRPDSNAFGTDHFALPVAALMVLMVGAAWGVRWVIGNRFVSQFSTGGTSISFDKPPESYFDEYLDEIVAFFDATEPALVIFEDLDRFDEPRIFDSLRELNTLINASAHWKNREQPLRFVYAIKDSLFEKLGEGPRTKEQKLMVATTQTGSNDGDAPSMAESVEDEQPDAAKPAVERANRTKFFEVVIPVVPFLSHTNARDLLGEELKARKLPTDEELKALELPAVGEIDRELLDVVARHTTDMRLLINICNEFVVYAERLLWIDAKGRAPGMTADELFALVVYKNFHLADFEALPHRGSALDTLEERRRELVRDSIKLLQQDKRKLLHDDRLQCEQDRVASLLGDRLMMLPNNTGHTLVSLSVGKQTYKASETHQVEFWKNVAEARELSLKMSHRSGHASSPSFNRDALKALFPEALDKARWREPDTKEVAAKRASIEREVDTMRGADFSTLTTVTRFKVDGKTFGEYIEDELKSDLARDLVRRGFVNRYYAEYSAVFYGDFLGVDVANFFRNSIWPNVMNVQAEFTTPNAVRNLLAHAPAGFASSRSVLNIQIVDHMLEHSPAQAKEVVAYLVAEQGEDALEFLNAFLSDARSSKTRLASLLAEHPWSGVFNHLALPDSVPDEDRMDLLDAALMNACSAAAYDIDDDARALIVEQHGKLIAFTADHGADRASVVFSFVRLVGLTVPTLSLLSDELRRLVVEEGAYALTADNLRSALGIDDTEPISMERIRQNDAVWQRCREDLDAYLVAAKHDDRTPYLVLTADVLSSVTAELGMDLAPEQLAVLLQSSAPDAALTDITEAYTAAWPAIADARRIVPNATNLHEYAKKHGVDKHLAKVLVDEHGTPVDMAGLEDADPEVIHDLKVRILNASQALGSEYRVELVLELDPDSRSSALDPTELQPAGDDLLADLLTADLVPDTAATFKHFLTAGWGAVSKAFANSKDANGFLTPELVDGHVLDLLQDPLVPRGIKTKVVTELGTYVADGAKGVLREAASFAHVEGVRLDMPQVEQIAPYVSDPEHVLSQLARMSESLDGYAAVRALGQLGGDYEGFNGSLGHEFDVPGEDSIKAVLGQLRKKGLVELPRGGKRNRKKVKLL